MSYFGKTSRLLEVRIKEHGHNLTQGLMEKERSAQHAYEECHQVSYYIVIIFLCGRCS